MRARKYEYECEYESASDEAKRSEAIDINRYQSISISSNEPNKKKKQSKHTKHKTQQPSYINQNASNPTNKPLVLFSFPSSIIIRNK